MDSRHRSTEDAGVGDAGGHRDSSMALRGQRRGNVSLAWRMRCHHRPASVQWCHMYGWTRDGNGGDSL